MGKRAPILPEGYNPVGEALKKAVTPLAAAEPGQPKVERNVIELRREERKPAEPLEPQPLSALPPRPPEKVPVPDVPMGRELKLTSFRFRCTENERKKWHSVA